MKQCTKCKTKIPSRYKIEGVYRSTWGRKNCIKCVPYKGRPELRNSEENKDFVCVSCDKTYKYKKWSSTKKLCVTCNKTRFYDKSKTKKDLVKYRGGKCQQCGYFKCADALDFHHLNPLEKSFGISRGIYNSKSFENLKTEADKCILVCRNCHGEIHENEKGHHRKRLKPEPKSWNRICEQCDKKFVYKIGGYKKCNSCMANGRRFKKKKDLVDYKGGKCSVCKYNGCVESLDFHHLDPSQKDFVLSGNHCRKIEDLKREVDKCALVCRNCHAEIHAGIVELKQV